MTNKDTLLLALIAEVLIIILTNDVGRDGHITPMKQNLNNLKDKLVDILKDDKC